MENILYRQIPFKKGTVFTMMEYPVTSISSYAHSICGPHKKGYVHSVYRKTINFSIDGQLFALQAEGSPLSPVSLVTSLSEKEMSTLPIHPKDSVTTDGHSVSVHTGTEVCHFCFSDAKETNLDMSRKTCTDITKLIQNLHCVMDYCKCQGFRELFVQNQNIEKSDQFLTLSAAQNDLQQAKNLYKNNDYENAAQVLAKLIGLGIGLTPSGDDFLCGVLAGILLSKEQNHPFARHLKETIQKNIQNTNDISQTFLRCSCIGQFSQAVNTLTGVPSPTEIYESFTSIGHSSGIDTLCGILYALEDL